MSVQIHEIPTPTEADTRQARESLRQISHFPTFGMSDLSIRIPGDERTGAEVAGIVVLMELSFLSGRSALSGLDVRALLTV